MSSEPKLPTHLPALDGLRGLAILSVIAHMLGLLTDPSNLAGKALSAFFAVGWVGVQLFFVLSGFLITGILLDTQRAQNHFSGFYARRTLRIFPLYYGTLFVAFVVLPLLGPVTPALQHDRGHQIWLWSYLSNWVTPTEAGSHAFPHFWSLAVEEQFYFVWPFLLFGKSPRRCVQLCLALVAASIAVRLGMWWGGKGGAIYTFTATRMDALVLGAAAAAVFRMPSLAARLVAARARLWWASLAIFVAGALVTHGYALDRFMGAAFGYTFLSIAFTLIVFAAAAGDAVKATGWASLLRAAPLRTVGKYSYAMYVFHKLLHDFVGKPLLERFHLDAAHSATIAVGYVVSGTLVTLLAAFLSYHLYEKHFLRLKNRFSPRGISHA